MNFLLFLLFFVLGFIVSLFISRSAVTRGAGQLRCCKNCSLKSVISDEKDN